MDTEIHTTCWTMRMLREHLITRCRNLNVVFYSISDTLIYDRGKIHLLSWNLGRFSKAWMYLVLTIHKRLWKCDCFIIFFNFQCMSVISQFPSLWRCFHLCIWKWLNNHHFGKRIVFLFPNETAFLCCAFVFDFILLCSGIIKKKELKVVLGIAISSTVCCHYRK